MIFGKKNHLVGLDIGSSFIKAAKLKVTAKKYVLQKFGMSRISPGSIVNGRVTDMKILANDIRLLFKTHEIREKNVAIAIGGQSVIIKTINIPVKDEKELHDMIHAEVEQYIPYDIDDVNIDYQILGESTFFPEQMNVLLVAVKKDLIGEYIDLIKMAGLNLRVIDVDIFVLQNIYEMLSYENREKITLLIDVGASKISLNILRADTSSIMRDIGSGTNQILEEVAKQFDISIDEATRVIIDGEISDMVNQKGVREICLKIAQSWCSEICEVINTHQSEFNDEKVERIILSGGGVFVEGFNDCLVSELNTDVSIINPFEGLIVNERKFSDSFILKVSAMGPIAIGLALRRIDDKN